MILKWCFKCDRLLPRESEFYKHPATADGRLGKCKECTKKDVRANYRAKIDQYREYEVIRFRKAERKIAAAGYQRTHRSRNRDKYLARQAVSNALRDGRLLRQPCQLCGNHKSQAHHGDHSKPLDVEWLCFRCHRNERHGQSVKP